MAVMFNECSDEQANFGSGYDPRNYLTMGNKYELVKKEVHKWHTLYYLKGFEKTPFNSVCFIEI